MPFVKRDSQGQVTSVHREQDSPELQYLPPSHPDVQALLDPAGEASAAHRGELVRSDYEMIRVYEDLTDILMGKRLVVLTDFPQAAQEKIIRRKRLRSSLSPITEVLSPEDEQGLP